VLTPALVRDGLLLRKLQQGILTAEQVRRVLWKKLEKRKIVNDILRGLAHHENLVLKNLRQRGDVVGPLSSTTYASSPELVAESVFVNSTELLLDLRRQKRHLAVNRTYENCCRGSATDANCFRTQWEDYKGAGKASTSDRKGIASRSISRASMESSDGGSTSSSWVTIYNFVARCCIPETIRRKSSYYTYPFLPAAV